MLNVMSKLLNLGSPLAEVIRMSTCNPAREIKRPELGNLDAGADADIAVLRLDRGAFGLIDSAGALMPAKQMLACEMTIRHGKVAWDLNGRASQDWRKFTYDKKPWQK
jgi:dihydroorotase